MMQVQTKKTRNQAVECTRMAAAFLVVFIHCPFPGTFGNVVGGIGRLAVPLFFVISGYFSYGIDRKKAAKRLHSIFNLNVAGTLLYALWRVFRSCYYGENLLWALKGAVPRMKELVEWVLISVNPYAGHLWYLTSLLMCSLVLCAFLCFQGEEGAAMGRCTVFAYAYLPFNSRWESWEAF